MQASAHKYGAIRTEVDGVVFASKAEAHHYTELKALQQAGVIRDLELQPRYPLTVNGLLCGTYVADFRYVDAASGDLVVTDVKGVRTPVYRLKRKLMEAIYRIRIVEVTA